MSTTDPVKYELTWNEKAMAINATGHPLYINDGDLGWVPAPYATAEQLEESRLWFAARHARINKRPTR